ncbi:MAG: OmpA family protein [Bacteroidales bacterium]|jgi:outer membrane protein OmpA-like peptidoglycan-associated protein/Tol biopolymer transport system component|nr:OmpA family protein [Bacteroidales bacterium]
MENIFTKPQVYANTLKYVFIIILFSFFSFFSTTIFAQENKKAKKAFEKAKELIWKNNDKKAAEQLNKALLLDSNYVDAMIFLAEIYYNNSREEDTTRRKAFQLYERAISLDYNCDNKAHLRLGEYFLYLYNTKKAKEHTLYALSKFKEPKDKKNISIAKRRLEQIIVMDSLLSNPVLYNPENMGENINSIYDEYFPTLTADEQTLILTRLVPDTTDFGLTITMVEDFFQSNKEGDYWQSAQKMPPPFNSLENEGALSISPDGKVAYFARCNAKDGYGSCDLYYSEKVGNIWSKPKNMGPIINSSSWDSQPSIASDGRSLFFVSSRRGGKGGNDIWYSYKKDDGSWGKPISLDTTINTIGDEMYPFIHPSNTTLYFSSNYHLGMGGMDIFYSNIIDGKFTPAKNIGYPINTSSNETSFIVSPLGDRALFSTEIPGGYGGKDIYQFPLYKEAQPKAVAYMKGRIFDKITNNPIGVKFEIRNINNNRLVSATSSDSVTGNYLVILPLEENYALSATKKGYLFYSENFNFSSSDNKTTSIEKNIYLTPIRKNESVVMKNIFFQTNKADLLETSIAELNTLLKLLEENPSISIEISGHTDNTGDKQYNMSLSLKRATSVKNFLEEKGINPNRLKAVGFGDEKPLNNNTTEEEKAQNRRTEFRIISN